MVDKPRGNATFQLGKSAVIKSLAGLAIVIATVFLCAGTWRYWQGILYCALMLSMLAVSVLCAADNPALISERLKPGKGTKPWDKVYWLISAPLFFITLALGALDTGRFHLSPDLPTYVYGLACALYVIGHLIFAWARRTNRFFSSVVRIQTDRGHAVCQEGPYRYVRHPGYLGGFLYTVATPLLLGSLWALIPTGITLVLMIIRTLLEDRTLENELEGYKAYKAKVRHRIVPYIW